MNIRTTLMLMAATVAGPVIAQQPVEVYTAMTATSTVTATAAQRAEAMPALAVLSADCESCFTFTNIPAFIDHLHAMGAIDDDDYADMPDEIKAINSVAIGGGKGSAATLTTLMRMYRTYSANELTRDLKYMIAGAADEYKGVLNAELDKADAANIEAFKALLAQAKIAPAYGILVANSGYEYMIAEWYKALTTEMAEEAAMNEDMEFVTVDGFSGIKIQIPAEEAEPDPWSDEYEVAFMQEAVKRNFYVLFKLEGDKIIAVICENPADINTAATPETSILGTDKLAKADEKLNSGLHIAVYADAATNNAFLQHNSDDVTMVGEVIQNMFTALAAKGDNNRTTFTKAASAVGTFINVWPSLISGTATLPTTGFVSWNGKCVDADLSSDNLGNGAKTAKLSLLNKAADPNTIVYLESAYPENCKLPHLNTLIDAGMDLAEGVIAITPASAQSASATEMAQIKAFLPEAKQAVEALCTVKSGLDNSFALVIDNQATMPTSLGGKLGNTTSFPRLAIYSGVSDRSKLSEGWDALLSVAGKVAEKVGYDPAVVQMLPIAPKMAGNSTSYSIVLPWFTEDFVPNLTVSDTAFVVGTSAKLNAEIAETATGTLEFPGAVCTIKFAPLATMLRSVADDMADRAEAEAAKAPAKPAVAPVAVIAADDEEYDEEFDEDADYVDEDSFDDEDLYSYQYHVPSEAELRARNFNSAAEVAEDIAEYVDCINAAYTTKNGESRLRIQVNFKK